jgi:hypothetical protein
MPPDSAGTGVRGAAQIPRHGFRGRGYVFYQLLEDSVAII